MFLLLSDNFGCYGNIYFPYLKMVKVEIDNVSFPIAIFGICFTKMFKGIIKEKYLKSNKYAMTRNWTIRTRIQNRK